MNIAVLGLGNMGLAISERLLQGEHLLTVRNRSKGRADPLLEIGATEVDAPHAAVTPAEVVITSLADDDAVQEVALGEGGILSAIGDRTDVDCSTISPGLSAELCAALARFVALPILGAPQTVRSGDAMYPAGDDSETNRRHPAGGLRPPLAVRHRHLG